MNEIKLGRYKHYKGNQYKVLAIGKHTETLEDLVIYKALYDSKEFGDQAIWVRPLQMLQGKAIQNNKEISRFEYIGE